MRNLKLVVEFDGTKYAGWQFQPRHQTVQGELESAAGKVLQQKVTVYGCGRTDAGVSARAYVANFHTEGHDRIVGQFGSCPKAPDRLKLALNHFLPADILILSVEEAKPGFHARHSALGKTYVYRIVRRKSPLRRRHAWEYWFKLDVEKMRKAAHLFEGAKDFRAFCQTKDEDGVCHVRRVRVSSGHRDMTAMTLGAGRASLSDSSDRIPLPEDEVLVTVEGDRFLYKMVRRIVGALVACGSGRLTQKDIRAALAGRPCQPFQTAPAQGLLLDSVEY
jgi:tRNA pseudouridine38-40 synthase